jgi:hypothetical protein
MTYVAGNRPKCTVGHVRWHVHIEYRELHNASGENDFISRRII